MMFGVLHQHLVKNTFGSFTGEAHFELFIEINFISWLRKEKLRSSSPKPLARFWSFFEQMFLCSLSTKNIKIVLINWKKLRCLGRPFSLNVYGKNHQKASPPKVLTRFQSYLAKKGFYQYENSSCHQVLYRFMGGRDQSPFSIRL